MNRQNPHQPRGSLEAFVQGWEQITRDQGKHAAWLWQQEQLDFLFIVFSGTDSVNHRTRNLEQIGRIYRAADAALGDLLAVTDDQCIIGLLSDHGSTPAYRYISLFRALADKGWLHFRPQVAARFWRRLPGPIGAAVPLWKKLPEKIKRLLSWPLLRWDARLAAAYENIDWTRTKLFTRSGMGLLYVNRRDWRPQGCVSTADYDAFLNSVRNHFMDLRDEQGKPLFAQVLYGRDVYPDANPDDDPPDLVLQPAQWSDHFITGFPTDPLVQLIPDEREYGTHDPNGILLLAGPNIRADYDLGTVDLIDVAPTILALMALPVLRRMDGNVLHEICATPISVTYAETGDDAIQDTAFTADEAVELMERLKDLGYL